MASLISVGRGISLSSTTGLVSFEAPALTSVGGDVSGSRLFKLSQLRMPVLSSVGGSVRFHDFYVLNDFGFDSLESVGVDLRITNGRGVKIPSGFEALKSVGRGITFTGNSLLINLCTLSGVRSAKSFGAVSTNLAAVPRYLKGLSGGMNGVTACEDAPEKSVTLETGASAGEIAAAVADRKSVV
eukprot:UC1_evm1s953